MRPATTRELAGPRRVLSAHRNLPEQMVAVLEVLLRPAAAAALQVLRVMDLMVPVALVPMVVEAAGALTTILVALEGPALHSPAATAPPEPEEEHQEEATGRMAAAVVVPLIQLTPVSPLVDRAATISV